ncbi:ergot alkaloid biosynthesis protein [Dyella thiooxydans]|uniref:ergot alkaloid biosynthesis protein n=1 Tax=Dyella thiooxydans TaxID=445710 RepID=UPI0007C43B66|nr:ergot alkaloid biosynthesis protein [Dyella thiooxydans]
MAERILVTGGTGKTGARVAAALARTGRDVCIGTRHPVGKNDRRLDWSDAETAAAFEGCTAAYLVAPTDSVDHLAHMRPHLERAIDRGTRRFVLLSASSLERGGPMMGAVHDWLAQNAPEWVVLRPSWFMQNFSDGPHAVTIREEGAIYSATGTGRVGFIDAGDIAAAAVAALVAPAALNRDVVLTGPEALSYDNVAEILSRVLRRPVRHVALDSDSQAQRFEAQGLPPEYARMLSALDQGIAGGAEDRTTDGVALLTGHPPTGFRAFAEAAAPAWDGAGSE